MTLTSQDIDNLAPDGQVLSAGRKLATPEHWQGLGRNDRLLWGECLGSALYQVRFDFSDSGYKCSCPSRKQPCKHVIALLMLTTREGSTSRADPPDWAADWLAKRQSAAKRSPIPGEGEEKVRSAASSTQSHKRAQERQQRMLEGVDMLERWMGDIVRNGVAGLELQPRAFWEQQAARLVDSQAPGLAERVRRLAEIPHSGSGWPERLVAEMGKLELLLHAFRRADQLDAGPRQDVRQLVGWQLSADEVSAQGEHVSDQWAMVGQTVDSDGTLRVQRTWLVGLSTNRIALVLQFAAGSQTDFPFVATFNTSQRMELNFWPAAYPLRGRIHQRVGEACRLNARLPGHPTIADFLAAFAHGLACNPWLDRLAGVLHDVIPVLSPDGAWSVRDSCGAALPLQGSGYWRMLANSGGHPMDLCAEWDGATLRPIGFRSTEEGATVAAG